MNKFLKYFSKLDIIVKSKKQSLDLLKYSFLKILAFINVRLFRLKMCPKSGVRLGVNPNPNPQ
jgi:hypothetical protein